MRESDLIYQLGNQTLEVEKVWASFSGKTFAHVQSSEPFIQVVIKSLPASVHP